MLALAVSRFSLAERAMISWVGLRGAVPIILATFPLVAEVDGAQLIFDVVFFAVLVSVLVQGTTIPAVARVLGVGATATDLPSPPFEAVHHGVDGAQLHELGVGAGSPAVGRSLVELRLPTGSLVVLIRRDGHYVVPEGGTRMREGDTVMVLAESDQLDEVRRRLGPTPK
jgi:cell volume regulation protein A